MVETMAALVVREHNGKVFYEAKWRADGVQVKRRIGRAWLTRGADGTSWVPRRGRVPAGSFDLRRATVRAAELVREHDADADARRELRERAVTFREVAHAYLRWAETVKGIKPSTLRDHRNVLAEPGAKHRRGSGTAPGHVMAVLGDHPAGKVTTADVERLLARVAATGVSPRTVNKHRQLVSAIYNYAIRPSTGFGLTVNPAADSDKRREPPPAVLAYYSPEEVEAIARQLESQDAEAVRIAAYCGLRQGELLALRWSDVSWTGRQLVVQRAFSAGVETTTKSGKVRAVGLPDQAMTALDRLSKRQHFTSDRDLVIVGEAGGRLDGSALTRRYKRACVAAGVRVLKFHDLRHTFGSLLTAGGMDVVNVSALLGHSKIETTSRYLHARPAGELADRMTAIFTPAATAAATTPESERGETAGAGRP